MSNPLISIIIPHYNHAKELQKTLESVFGQTVLCHPNPAAAREGSRGFKDGILRSAQNDKQIAVIVIDDGSDEKQKEYLRKKIIPRFSQVKFIFAEHRGAAAARNRGFQESTGQYLIFWDADIVAQPEMLEKMKKALDEYPEASYAYSSFKFGWKTFECGLFDGERLKKVNYITTTSLIRREHFPGFDESLKKFQDWDLWLTMLGKGHEGVWVPEVLFQIKQTSGTMSRWLPSFLYHFPWLPLPALKKYFYWQKIVQNKHRLLWSS